MIAKINNIPVYDALITDEGTGMWRISLVDDPAVMSNFLSFSNERKQLMYSVQDEEKRLVRGVVMRADFPIYRLDPKMGEFYIIYKAEEIRKMAEKYLAEGRQNEVNVMHEEGSEVDGVQMVQYFIKDTAAGVSPAGFEDIADGSLFAEFHIVNDDVWASVKDGSFKGFSLEGDFELAPDTEEEEVQAIADSLEGKFSRFYKHISNSMSKFSRFKAALAKVFAEFGNITTDKGILAWDGDDDIAVGVAVYIEDAEGNRTPAEDGEYLSTENLIYVVADGKVADIKDAEVEVEMGKISTDKGELLWEGEEDLKEGDLVFVIKDEESVPAEDGDYTTEDGKVIKVADGKVESITDPSAEVATEEFRAKRRNLFSKIKAAYSESYEDKMQKIYEAIIAFGYSAYSWISEAGDDYAVLAFEDEQTYELKYVRFDIAWDAEGNAIVSNPTEVVEEFVPADDTTPDPAPTEAEMTKLKAENKALKAEMTKLKKMSAAKPAHEEVKSISLAKTGVKSLDNLARILSAK